MRPVAAERDHAPEVREEAWDGGNERGGDPAAALSDAVYARWNRGGDVRHVFRGAHHRHVDGTQRLNECQRIAQHALGELDDVARWVRTGQSRLHETFPGSLRHDHDGAADPFRSAIDRGPAHAAGPGSAGLVAARSRFFAMPARMHQAAPLEPLHVPLIFEMPMPGW